MELYLVADFSILSPVVLVIDNLDYDHFAGYFVHCFKGSTAQALEELILLKLATSALRFKKFQDDALAVSFLREVEYKFDSLREFDGYREYCDAIADLTP